MPRHTLITLAYCLLLATLPAACAVADPQAVLLSPERLAMSDESAEIAAFLEDQYGVALGAGAGQEEFAAAIAAVAGPLDESPVPPDVDEPGLSGVEAVVTALYHANLDELAATYAPEQVASTLAAWARVPADLAPGRAAALGLALAVLEHPACAHETAAQAARLRGAAAAGLAGDAQRAAAEWAVARPLALLVQELCPAP